jgi:hypothetical protein
LEISDSSHRRHSRIAKAVTSLKFKESQVALMTLAIYTDGACEQWERIKSDQEKAGGESLESRIYESKDNQKSEEHNKRFWDFKHQEMLDIHFYFISGHKVSELADFIAEREQNERLKEFWEKWRPILKVFHDARIRFENPHMYLQEGWQKAYFLLFGETDGSLVIRNQKFDISHASLEILTTFFDDLIELLESIKPTIDT